MTHTKSKIFVTHQENIKLFGSKLSTLRNGFCEITRNVNIEQDPDGIYETGEYGFITVNSKKIIVLRRGLERAFEVYA